MAWVIVGLGNPGEEYEGTRHNTGRIAVEYFARKHGFAEWKADKKSNAQISRGIVEKNNVVLVNPDTFMNKSGSAVLSYVKSVKAAERMVVAYDDLDLPLGVVKISYDRGSGGHKGLESIMRAVKTKKFIRVRIGVSPATPSGKLKKPNGEEEVIDFILKPFKEAELQELKKVFKTTTQAIETTMAEGRERAMNTFN